MDSFLVRTREVSMLRTFLLLTLIVCRVVSAAAQSATEEVLPAGTLLQCTLDEPNFSSRSAQIGDPILCHVGALAAFGHSVFPRGAYLAGHFQEYRDPGRVFGKGWIELAGLTRRGNSSSIGQSGFSASSQSGPGRQDQRSRPSQARRTRLGCADPVAGEGGYAACARASSYAQRGSANRPATAGRCRGSGDGYRPENHIFIFDAGRSAVETKRHRRVLVAAG